VQMAIRRCPLSSCAVSRRRTHSAIASKREVKALAEAQAARILFCRIKNERLG
jgi:hypothetical protein